MVHLCFIFAADNLIVEQLKTIKLWLDYSYYL